MIHGITQDGTADIIHRGGITLHGTGITIITIAGGIPVIIRGLGIHLLMLRTTITRNISIAIIISPAQEIVMVGEVQVLVGVVLLSQDRIADLQLLVPEGIPEDKPALLVGQELPHQHQETQM